MIALLCLLVIGAYAAPYEQSEFGVRTLSTPILEVEAPQMQFSYGQRQLVEVAAPVPVFQEDIPRIVQVQNDFPITKFDHTLNPGAGEYSLDFETSNGISTKEFGFLKAVPVATRVFSDGYDGQTSEEEIDGIAQAKSGVTSWCSPEGIKFTLTYTADDTGYHPEIIKGSCDTVLTYDSYAAPVEE